MAVKALDVFVNCPFDDAYRPIFNATVFAVVRYGFRVRCALEADDASENRLAKICGIIAECKFGIHDISRTDAQGDPPLPRFNMPLELGLFLGAKRYGGRDQKQKVCLILDKERYRFQRYISDIAGQDIHSHGNNAKLAILKITTWLRAQPGGVKPGGGDAVWNEYQGFRKGLTRICQADRVKISELSFLDYNGLMAQYIETL